MAALTSVCAWSLVAREVGSELAGGHQRSFQSLFPAWQDGLGSLPWPQAAAGSWSLFLGQLLRRSEVGISSSPRAGGCPGAARAACTKALHTSVTPGKGNGDSCTQEVTGDGGRHPHGIGLGFQQPLSTRLFEACVGAPGHLEHPLTLSFTLSLSSQLAAGREKQNKLFLRDQSKAE